MPDITRDEIKEQIEILKRPHEEKWGFSQYNAMIERIVTKIGDHSNSLGESWDEFEHRVRDAKELIFGITHALYGGDEEKENTNQHEIWPHQDILAAVEEGFESKASNYLENREGLEFEAVKYLQRPWMQDDYLEWVMIDALCFDEALRFSDTIKKKISQITMKKDEIFWKAKGSLPKIISLSDRLEDKWWLWEVFFLFVVPALIYFAFGEPDHTDNLVWGIPLYLIVLTIYFFRKRHVRSLANGWIEPRQKYRAGTLNLMDEIMAVYMHLGLEIVDPRYLKERLLMTTSQGAYWPDVVFLILENAIRRDSLIWNHRGEPFLPEE